MVLRAGLTRVIVVLALTPWAGVPSSRAAEAGPGPGARRQESHEYRIVAGDELDIRVEEACIYGTRFQVDERGLIDVPFAGEVRAAGRTVPELATELTRALGRYLKDPRVHVRLIAGRT